MDQEQSGLLGTCRNVPGEEVRFAVVLNGGVSLAVWMGGVVLELDRLTKAIRSESGPYSVLKRLTGCTARADVITGTSAGGINGAALALTQVNRAADPGLLRDLWIDQGRIETLLRPPFQGQPTSLLRGDEYFLPKLNAALELLAEKQGDWQDPEDAPIDLTITTTVLRGNQAVSVDSMGQQLPQSLHAARFQWKRYPNTRPEQDPFSRENLKRTAHRLALASRSSASFPVAFEPSFVPVGSPDHKEPADPADLTEEIRLRPDMAAHVEAWGTGKETSDRSRYCADGGALANTPTLAALQAIESMPASGPVRRVMLLVFPHAPAVGVDPPDTAAEPLSFVGTLSGVLGALTAQGSRTYVESLEQHNLVAAGRRGTRADLLGELGSPEELEKLTTSIYRQYRRLRRWRAGRDLAAWRTGAGGARDIAATELPAGWSFERVREAAEQAQDRWKDDRSHGGAGMPYAPDREPLAGATDPAEGGVVYDGWGWGVTAALGIAEAVADLMRRLVFVLGPGADFEAVTATRQRALDLAEELRGCRELTDDYWRDDELLLSLEPDQHYWALRLACYDHLMLGSVSRDTIREKLAAVTLSGRRTETTRADLETSILGALDRIQDQGAGPVVGIRVRGHVDQLVIELRRALTILKPRSEELAKLDPTLPDWERVLAPETDLEKISDPTLLARLLQLEIAATTLGDEVTTGSSFPVDLVQVSAQTENPFATYTRSADEKLGGDAINRFGGFLKRSWRVNDWMWGRADGASMLCRTMLDPKRIRRTAVLSGFIQETVDTQEQLDEAHALAAVKARETVDGILVELGLADIPRVTALRAQAVRELTPVLCAHRTGAACVLPSALPTLAAIFAWAVHLESIPAEMPTLAGAIAADRVDGANTRSRGELFVEEHAALLRRLDAAVSSGTPVEIGDRVRALEVFDRAGIGWEPLSEEGSSDLMIRTATSAAAVMATVADSDRSGLGGAKPVTRAFRGAMLLPYWAVFGLTSRGTLARGLALLALALGGASLALALFGVLSPGVQPIATALGTGAVLGAFAYGALRTGSLLHGIVLLTPLIPLLAFAYEKKDADPEGRSTLVIVLAFALGLMILGSIGVASGSVWASLDRLAERQGLLRPRPPKRLSGAARTAYGARLLFRRLLALLLVAGKLALLAGLVGAVAWAVAELVDDGPMRFVQENRSVLALAAVGVAALGGWFAHQGGRWLQVLTRRSGRSFAYAAVANPSATSAGWAVVYGLVFLALTWVISLDSLFPTEKAWRPIAFATAVVFAGVLLLVLPWLLPLLALRDVRRAEVRRAAVADAVRRAEDSDQQEDRVLRRRQDFAHELVVRGASYRRFVQATDDQPHLTKHGIRIEQRVTDARAAARLAAQWHAGRVPSPSEILALGTVLEQWSEEWRAHISPSAVFRLEALQTSLGEARAAAETSPEDPPPTWAEYAADVRHRFDRLVVSLGRDPRRQSVLQRIWRKVTRRA